MPVPRSAARGRARSRRAGRAPAGQAARLARLRERSSGAGDDDMVVASVRFRLPEWVWVGPFTRRHPEARVEFLSVAEVTQDVSVSDCWIAGRPAGKWTAEIARFADVRKVQPLAEVGGGGVYRITFVNPPIVYLYRELGLPLPLPVWMHAGVCGWEIVARVPMYRRLKARLTAVDPGARTVSLRRSPFRSHLPELSDPEQALLAAAVGRGYFDVPKRVTLERLARELGRSRSAVSDRLRAIEERLLDSAFSGTSFRLAGFRTPPPTAA